MWIYKTEVAFAWLEAGEKVSYYLMLNNVLDNQGIQGWEAWHIMHDLDKDNKPLGRVTVYFKMKQ